MILFQSCGSDDGGGSSITPVSLDFSSTTLTVAESAGAQTVTVLFDAEAPVSASFDVTISGDATYTDDFTTSPDGSAGSFTVSVSEGDAAQSFTFTPVDNDQVDGDKTVIFTISGAVDGVQLGDDVVLTVTIDDDEGPSNVDFAVASNSVTEDEGEFTVTLDLATTTTATGTAEITISGDAEAVTTTPAATDNVFTVSAASGEDEVTFTITPVNDSELTDDSEVVFTLTDASGGLELGSSQLTYTLTITEDDVVPPVTIASIRADYETNGTSTLESSTFIEGIVISEKSNVTGKNIVIQDESDGIVVRFTEDNVDFDLGDELRIDVSGGTLDAFNGLVQVSDVALTAVEETGTGTVTPVEISVTELLTGEYQSQLVTVTDVAIEGANGTAAFGSFQSEIVFNIEGDQFETFVRGGSLLENEVIPLGAGSMTGIPSEFSGDIELVLRQLSDINFTSVATLDVTAGTTDFGQVANGATSSASGYTISVQTGTLQGDVTVVASDNFELLYSGPLVDVASSRLLAIEDYTSEITIPAEDLNGGSVSVSVRFAPNSGINGAKEGSIDFTSFGVAEESVDVSGEETGASSSTLLFEENFDYGTTDGDFVNDGMGIGTANWTAFSGQGANPAQYSGTTSLSFTSYPSTGVGGSITLADASGSIEDVARTFATQTSGTVYASALISVAPTASTSSFGDYFMLFRQSSGSFFSRVTIKDDGAGNLLFGIRDANGDTNFSATNFSYNTTYLVVFTYTPGTGGANLYVLDAFASTEPVTATASSTNGTTIASDINQIAFRGDSDNPAVSIDGVRVALDWDSLMGLVAE